MSHRLDAAVATRAVLPTLRYDLGDIAHDPASVPLVRRRVRDLLRRSGVVTGADDLLLALTEVVANAITHAEPIVRVTVAVSCRSVHVMVHDGSTAPPCARQAEDTATNGRGMSILDQLTSRWGITAHRSGKAVWFELDRDDEPSECLGGVA